MAIADAPLKCVICGKSIVLKDTYLDENGKPVHEECYLAKTKGEKPDPQER